MRRGNLLALALMVLLVLVTLVAAFQYLTFEANVQGHTLIDAQDGLQRGDGLVRMLVSRLKKRAFTGGRFLIDLPRTGVESGRWDGRAFALGWRWERIAAPEPRARMVVWTRFLGDGPGRTWRYDLDLAVPTMLRPRVVEVRRVAVDDIDPLDAAARDARFARAEPAPEVEALVESATDLAATAGAVAPATLRASLSAEAPARAASFAPFLAQLARVRDTGGPVARVAEAHALAGLAAGLPRRAQDAAGWQLSCALIRWGGDQPRDQRRAAFAEARLVLERMLAPGDCCGEPLATWKLAHLVVLMRALLDDPAEFAAARAEGRRLLSALAQRRHGFVHARADVEVVELERTFGSLWKTRVASAVQTTGGNYLVISMLHDGSEALVHLESSRWLEVNAFRRDGGGLVVSALEWTPSFRRCVELNVSLDGLSLENYFPAPLATAPPEDWWRATVVRPHPGGEGVLFGGLTLDPATPGGNVADGLFGLTSRQPGRAAFWTDGDRAVRLPPDGLRTLNGSGFAWSPTGDRVAGLIAAGTGIALSIRSLATVRGGPPFPAPQVERPLPGLDADWIGTPTWERFGADEWLAIARTPGGGGAAEMDVRFLDPAGPARDHRRVISGADYAADTQRWTESVFARDPPSLLVTGGTRLYAIPLPPSTAAPRELPEGLAGGLEAIANVALPPWGGMAFFTAKRRGAPGDTGPALALHALDLASGGARVLAGAGGPGPRTLDVSGVAVSPVPERSR